MQCSAYMVGKTHAAQCNYPCIVKVVSAGKYTNLARRLGNRDDQGCVYEYETFGRCLYVNGIVEKHDKPIMTAKIINLETTVIAQGECVILIRLNFGVSLIITLRYEITRNRKKMKKRSMKPYLSRVCLFAQCNNASKGISIPIPNYSLI